jgi:hypothetical protein
VHEAVALEHEQRLARALQHPWLGLVDTKGEGGELGQVHPVMEPAVERCERDHRVQHAQLTARQRRVNLAGESQRPPSSATGVDCRSRLIRH